MKPAFTFDEIRQAEKCIIVLERIPPLLLMENAGKNSLDVLLAEFPDLDEYNIFIICGKGNNAGDGLVLARHLVINGYDVKISLIETSAQLKGDALINYQIFRKWDTLMNYQLIKKSGEEKAEFIFYESVFKAVKKNEKTIIIDAILGTGIKGSLSVPLLAKGGAGGFLNAITLINKAKEKNKKLKIVSLDVPSGLMSGEQVNPVVNADLTITMGSIKTELLFGEGKENSGKVIVVPIGITENLIEKYNTSGKYIIEIDDVRKIFPRRKKSSYKYSNGKVLVIGGSRGLAGSIIMSSYSAIKSGAGGVCAAIPESLSRSFNKKVYEVMTVPLDETEEGSIRPDSFPNLQKRMEWADAVLLGPGISTNDSTKEFIFEVIKNCDKPLVIDADALNVLSTDLSVLKTRKFKNEIILTPHIGEFSRLSGTPSKEIGLNRFEIACNFVKEHNLNLVLKSETTITCTTDGKIYINSSANEALSTAGSGDVLSGIIVSLVAQSTASPYPLSKGEGCLIGVYLHGLCADLYYNKYGNKQTASPQDIIKLIPKAVSTILHPSPA